MNFKNLSVVKDVRKEGKVLGASFSSNTLPKAKGDVKYSCSSKGNTSFVFRADFLEANGLNTINGLDQVSTKGILPVNINEFAFMLGKAENTRYFTTPKGKVKSKSIVCKNAEYFLINQGMIEKGIEKELYLDKVENDGTVYFTFTVKSQSPQAGEEVLEAVETNDDEL